MAKPDPALLDPARYPFTCAIEPRFGDLDVNMHVNNVAMTGFLEDARVRFHRAVGDTTIRGGRTSMVASLAVEFLAEVAYPEAVTIACAIERLGRTSLTVIQCALQSGVTVAFARTVSVVVGPDGPAPLPAELVAAAPQWMIAR